MIRLIPLLALVAGAAWCYQDLLDKQDEARRAADQLGESQRLAQQIAALRQEPARVSTASQSATALAQVVEQAATQAGLPRDQIVNIDPAAPRRIGDTDYQEQATTVELRSVPLFQIVAFVDALELSVTTLILRVPHHGTESQEEAEETWNAEVILTDRIYAPKSPAVSR